MQRHLRILLPVNVLSDRPYRRIIYTHSRKSHILLQHQVRRWARSHCGPGLSKSQQSVGLNSGVWSALCMCFGGGVMLRIARRKS